MSVAGCFSGTDESPAIGRKSRYNPAASLFEVAFKINANARCVGGGGRSTLPVFATLFHSPTHDFDGVSCAFRQLIRRPDQGHYNRQPASSPTSVC